MSRWLASRNGRWVLLFIAACFSLPPTFEKAPTVGLDPSWSLALQMAVLKHSIFGREFVLTYGPLGYLLNHAALSKAAQLFYDFFLLGSLVSIYRQLLPEKPRLWDALLLIGLALVTKQTLGVTAVLFTVLCYWLWQVWARGDGLSVGCVLIAAILLFFGKINYGIIVLGLLPSYAVGLMLLHPKRRTHGLCLFIAFPLLVWLGTICWHVDLRGFLRAGTELITGYNEAMFRAPASTPFVTQLACVFVAGMGIITIIGRGRLPWRAQAMILPLIALAAFLLFKNAFVRSDLEHNESFFEILPLILAVWSVSWRGYAPVYCLLAASLLYPLANLPDTAVESVGPGLAEWLPVRYAVQAVVLPWHLDSGYLERRLSEDYPGAVLPTGIRSVLGQSTVDVMPWENSIAIENRLNYRPRPVPGSYTVYTPWLDEINARFLDSTNAPDWMLFTYGQEPAVDHRPAAWDDSLAKVALLENYKYDSEFMLDMREDPPGPLHPGTVFLLKRVPHIRRLVPVATNEVSMALGEKLSMPATMNLVFLTLEVNRSTLGKLVAAAWRPGLLVVKFDFGEDYSETFKAILPMMKCGVLVNRRVESIDETRDWLKAEYNVPVSSISFNSSVPWAFQLPLKGRLVEYRWEDDGNIEHPTSNTEHRMASGRSE